MSDGRPHQPDAAGPFSFGPNEWLSRERVDDHAAVYLIFGENPPAHRGAFPRAAMNDCWEWLYARGLIRTDPPAHDRIPILQASSYVVLADLLTALRSQQPLIWGRRLLAHFTADDQSAQQQRELALVEHVRGRGILERDWHQLGSKGITKKDLFRALKKTHPDLFKSQATFDHFFKRQERFRMRPRTR